MVKPLLPALPVLPFILSLSLFASTGALAAEPAPLSGVGALRTATWTCQAFYLPARGMWPRTVELQYDGAVVRTVLIDGIAAYTFTINGSTLMTAIDGERIQFDVAALTWTSDLRGLVSSSGRCAL